MKQPYTLAEFKHCGLHEFRDYHGFDYSDFVEYASKQGFDRYSFDELNETDYAMYLEYLNKLNTEVA